MSSDGGGPSPGSSPPRARGDAADAPQLPLAELFEEARRLAAAAERDRAPDTLARALGAVARCEEAAERAALFSSNEDVDDVATGSLRFLLLPSMRAELLAAAPCAGGPEQRAPRVAAALAALWAFLRRMARYGVLKGAAAAAAGLGARDAGSGSDEDEDEEGGGGGGGSGARGAVVARRGAAAQAAVMADAGAKRAAKIERFKRTRALAAAAEQLRARREEARRRGGGGGDGGDEGSVEGGEVGGPGGWDEEDERRLWLMQLEGAALAAIDTRDALAQEEQLLRHMAAARLAGDGGDGPRSESGRGASTSGGGGGAGDARMRPGARRPGPGAPGGGGGGGAVVLGGGGGRGVLVEGDAASRAAMMTRLSGIAEALTLNERSRLRQQVFTPYVPLPTITVEQQGEMELAAAREREVRSAEAEAARRAREDARRSDDEDDEEVARARAWDEFKDDNPAGWGNSKLRPCA